MGIGEKKTPKPFVNACDVFVYTENLVTEKKAVLQPRSKPKYGAKKTKEEKEELDPLPLLTQAFEMAVQQDGWASLASMGNALYQLDPGFDPRTYGYKQLSKMMMNFKNRFEMHEKDTGGFFVKIKE
jgi:Fe-S-cluster formation regulator IscX/YfhJ